jgi:hypothetical protein
MGSSELGPIYRRTGHPSIRPRHELDQPSGYGEVKPGAAHAEHDGKRDQPGGRGATDRRRTTSLELKNDS